MIEVSELSHIINKAAQATNTLQEFYWAVYDNLPEDCQKHFTKKLAAEFYEKHKRDGRPFDPEIFQTLLSSNHS